MWVWIKIISFKFTFLHYLSLGFLDVTVGKSLRKQRILGTFI